MFSRSRANGSSSGGRRTTSFPRRGRRGQTQPKQWVLDLEADDDQPSEKIDFHVDESDPLDGALARLDPHGEEGDLDEAIELKQWRESVKVGHVRTVCDDVRLLL